MEIDELTLMQARVADARRMIAGLELLLADLRVGNGLQSDPGPAG